MRRGYADDSNVYVAARRPRRRCRGPGRCTASWGFRSTKPECRMQRFRAQVPGLRAVSGQGPRGEVQGGRQGVCKLQSPNPVTHRPLQRTQHGASGGKALALPVGLVGRLTSDWRKPLKSGESWTNGCATDYGRSSSNIGSGHGRSTGNSKHLVRTTMLPNGWLSAVDDSPYHAHQHALLMAVPIATE